MMISVLSVLSYSASNFCATSGMEGRELMSQSVWIRLDRVSALAMFY